MTTTMDATHQGAISETLGQTAPNAVAGAPVQQMGIAGVQQTALSQRIAKAISLGLAQAPQDAGGWAKLADYYSTPAGGQSLDEAQSAANSAPARQGPAAVGSNAPGGLSAFLAAERQQESGGDYQVTNSIGASGAYQFIQSTWDSQAKAAGYGQYAGKPAADAPAQVQDAVAGHMAQQYYKKFGNWGDVAKAWYAGPGFSQDNQGGAQRGGPSIDEYAASVIQKMGASPNTEEGSPTAGNSDSVVQIAKGQLGTPYSWGGEAPGKGFDCSGLVQWAYGQAGVKLPRVAQAQYDATAKIPNGAPLQPGDLLFFGGGPNKVSHVGIYIGNGKMLDAPHTGADVRIESYGGWGDFVGATRPGDPSGASTIQAATTASQPRQSYGQILQQVTDALVKMQKLYPGAGSRYRPQEA